MADWWCVLDNKGKVWMKTAGYPDARSVEHRFWNDAMLGKLNDCGPLPVEVWAVPVEWITPMCPCCHQPAFLTTGVEVYPHRPDLFRKKFWICHQCQIWVGCHPGTQRPLGRLANVETRRLKGRAHAAFDPMWQSGRRTRKEAYAWLARQLRIPVDECHMGEMPDALLRRVPEVCMVKMDFLANLNQS